MSSKNSSTSAGGATKYEARLCHVVKRPDFDGYGFNLHAEKGRPGQYIGKVDDGSPAEAAGLRQGDRILEVNGTNITTETHKKVVELIKGIPNETKLLVIDPRADANDLKAAIAKNKSANASAAAGHVDVNDNSKQTPEKMTMEKTMANGKDSLNENSSKQANQNKHDVNGSNGNSSPTTNTTTATATVANNNEDVNNKKNSSNSSSANNNVDTTANNNKKMMTNGEAKKQQQQQPAAVEHIIEDTKTLSVSGSSAAESNGKMAMASANGSATKDGPKLNLNMTAAELRAQLAARKKYDPKNDVCDLRKKYEIIQKM